MPNFGQSLNVPRLYGSGPMTGQQTFAAFDVPADATFVKMTLDRQGVVNRSRSDFIEFWMEMSLDGGIKWGGGINIRGKSYPLDTKAGCAGGSHGMPGVSEDASFTTEMPPEQGMPRKFRGGYSVRGSAADFGLQVDFL